jgi:hypothetical protein
MRERENLEDPGFRWKDNVEMYQKEITAGR